MNDKISRLELENMLSQIYNNNYIFDGSMCTLYFNHINFITLNSVDIYINHCKIRFYRNCLNILIDSVVIEIKYNNINNLSVNLMEA